MQHSVIDPLYKRLLVATAILGMLVFFWGLGDIGLMSFNEARRAIPASIMFNGGDWLLPRINGELYLTKPPLLYWLSATAAHLLGAANEWAVRLPSALAATVTVVVSYRYALRKFGTWSALFTAQILIANAGFAMFARRAEIEMLLAALCSGALLAALHYTRGDGGRGWLRISYLLLGLAVLTKGPLALLFVTLPLLLDALYGRTARQWDALRDLPSWGIFLLIGLSWYAAVTWQLGPDIWATIARKDMLNKMQGAAGEPFYNYFLWLLTDFFPVGLLLFAAPLATWRRWKLQGDRIALLIAAAAPLLLYTLFSDKHAKYLLPIYPFLAILLGIRLGELFEQAGQTLRRILITAGLLLPALYAGFFGLAETRIFDYRIAAFSQFSQWLGTTQGIPLYGYRDLDERLMFYAQRDIPLIDASTLHALRTNGRPALILVENSRIDAVRPLTDCQVKIFNPYLKKNKSLAVFGLGAACSPQHQEAH